jgi:hypothetical protein
VIEIIVIISLWKKVGRMVEAKGHPSVRTFQFMLPVAWFGGQIAGAFTYAFVVGMQGGQPEGFVTYLCGLAGAAIGLAILFGIIRGLEQRELPEQAHYQPRRRSAL